MCLRFWLGGREWRNSELKLEGEVGIRFYGLNARFESYSVGSGGPWEKETKKGRMNDCDGKK